MPKKSKSKAPAPTTQWQHDPAHGGLQDWLNSRGTPYEPNLGADEHGFDITEHKLHPGTSVDPSITHDPGDAPVPVELAGDEKMAVAKIGDLVAQIEGMYGIGNRSQGMLNNEPLVGPRKGPLINVPLNPPRSGPLITGGPVGLPGGPLINVPTMRMPGGVLASSAPQGLAPGRPVPRGPSVEDILKLKAQIQAKAHGYDRLMA